MDGGKRKSIKEITFRRKKVFPGPTAVLEGQRGVHPTPTPDSELTQMAVKQIKSEIYGWRWCGWSD